jgi:hypothetical protein
MDIIPENLLSIFSTMIIGLKRLANLGVFDQGGEAPKNEKFTLENLMACFLGINRENFLTEAPLSRFLSSLRNTGEQTDNSGYPDAEKTPISKALPEGTQVTFAVSPCDLNGLQLLPEMLDDQKNSVYPYFMVFYGNPEDKQGMVTANPEIKSMPLLSIYPQEFVDQCSFVVKYPEQKPPVKKVPRYSVNEHNLAYLDGECRKIYASLQELAGKHL